jgi:hypothetical protein
MQLGKITYTFVMIKNPKHDPKEPYLYFISDLKDARAIASHYLKRWKIECCFKNLKTNGFNIEDINLQNPQKIELMTGVLAIVYLLAIREGMLRHLVKPIALKKYKDGKTQLAISYFRLGNTIIQSLFTDITHILKYLQPLLKQPLLKLSTSEILKNV